MLTNEDIVRNLPAELARIRRERNPTGRHIVLEGMLVAAPDEVAFKASAPHTYCRLCGAVFQTQQDRDSVTNLAVAVEATARRKRWSFEHSATHPEKAHQALAASGRYMTPEAAHRLIPLGIIPVTDMIFDPATAQAAAEAPRLSDEMEEIGHAVL